MRNSIYYSGVSGGMLKLSKEEKVLIRKLIYDVEEALSS